MSRFVQYLLAIGFAALAMGVQIVLLPWLAVGALQLSANQVGWVQSAVLLPGVVLMLFGGAFADRPGAIRVLPVFYGMLLLSHGAMLWQVGLGLLALSSLLIYALLLGICNAFIQPLRDKVLPIFVASDGNLQTSVVQISLCVYVAQALGVALAGHMDTLGVPLILGLQCSAVFLSALLFFLLLRGKHVSSATAGIAVVADQPVQKPLISIRDGLTFVFRHRVLKHLMLLVGFNGFMHIGVFVVALPLLARDIYQQDALYFAGLQLVFVAGNIVATLGLLKRGQVDQLGRSVLFCLLYAGIIMMAISARPTLTGLLILVFVWGVVAGVSASLGKSLLHQQVADEYRGRVLSIYQLALFGAAPLGALACGYAVHVWGALSLFRFGGALSLILFVGYLGIRPLWHVAATNTPDP
ncbi:MFS transporter [Aestuariicella hydrocarbonica]|uniref:MFS transporter n=1 Tax=Pseudomaricurvus hydrocarbonicus TaxID=1470433 RepID=A0A9E5MJT2_9GAMM|nr:MFS transporter [Aestuariicella hydrocarbonica]NHO65604.1 MFS transporter [Aestuariicella hydrocarbonica]